MPHGDCDSVRRPATVTSLLWVAYQTRPFFRVNYRVLWVFIDRPNRFYDPLGDVDFLTEITCKQLGGAQRQSCDRLHNNDKNSV